MVFKWYYLYIDDGYVLKIYRSTSITGRRGYSLETFEGSAEARRHSAALAWRGTTSELKSCSRNGQKPCENARVGRFWACFDT